MTPLFTMRIPLPLLPLCIRGVRAVKRALARVECDLASLVEPRTVDDLVRNDGSQPCDNCGQPTMHVGSLCYGCTQEAWAARDTIVRESNAALFAYLHEPRCYACSQPDASGYCTKCAVLNTGRVAS